MMEKNVELSNIPSMSVGNIVKQLAEAYSSLVLNGENMNLMPSVMLWGPPGTGKSQAVRQIAKELMQRTGKKTNITDVRLLLFNPVDLRGIPTSNEDRTLAVWLKPKIFQMDGSRDVINILFLDEISAAPQSVQAAAYQITLDRVIGEHRLPDNCIVIAAGNRTTDKSVAYKMPKALANRLMHIEVKLSFSSWKKWAIENGVHPYVVGFLDFKRDSLMAFDPQSDHVAFPTPRSWEMVSNLLNHLGSEPEDIAGLISGLIGTSVASEFINWSKIYNELPDVDMIFDGKAVKVPQSADCLYALTSAMSSYAAEHRDDMGRMRNSIRYAMKMPPDFSVILMKDYMCIEKGFGNKLMKIPEFAQWMNAKGSLLNGSI